MYVSESRALATLEILAGLQTPVVIPAYVLIGVEFDEALVTELPQRALPGDWRANPPPASTQEVGDRWLSDEASAVLAVPSTLVPGERNFVLNPQHPDFRRIRIGDPEALHFDPRILPH